MDKIELFVSLSSLFGFPAIYFLCHFSYKVAIDKYLLPNAKNDSTSKGKS